MLYWLTGTAGSSARLYYENMHAGAWGEAAQRHARPAWPSSPRTSPSAATPSSGNNIVHWTEFDRGGHFAAMEAPDLLVADVRDLLPPLPVMRRAC